MSDRASFLRAIRANPDDDTPRLVFADWLDEHDQPGWAEFIRLQIELDPIRDRLDDPRVGELTEREAVLLGTHAHEWVGPAADIATGYPAFGPVFRRGLPEMVCLPLDTFLARGAELFAACPTVREVSLYGVQGREADLLTCPLLESVETLEIADWIDEGNALEDGARALRHVKRFRFWGDLDQFLPFHLIHLATADWPEAIEVVDLDDSRVRFGDTRAKIINERADRELIRIGKPFEARLPLAADIGHGLYPGRAAGRQVLAAFRPLPEPPSDFQYGGPPSDFDHAILHAVFFDDDGHLTGQTAYPLHAFAEHARENTDQRLEHKLRKTLEDTLGYTPAPVRVREFQTPELAVRLWPQAYVRDFLQRPLEQPPGTSDAWWRSRGGVLKRWLHEGRFIIEWDGREFTADATGRIVAS